MKRAKRELLKLPSSDKTFSLLPKHPPSPTPYAPTLPSTAFRAPFPGSRFQFSGLGFKVWVLGFKVEDEGFRGLGMRDDGACA